MQNEYADPSSDTARLDRWYPPFANDSAYQSATCAGVATFVNTQPSLCTALSLGIGYTGAPFDVSTGYLSLHFAVIWQLMHGAVGGGGGA